MPLGRVFVYSGPPTFDRAGQIKTREICSSSSVALQRVIEDSKSQFVLFEERAPQGGFGYNSFHGGSSGADEKQRTDVCIYTGLLFVAIFPADQSYHAPSLRTHRTQGTSQPGKRKLDVDSKINALSQPDT